MIFPLLQEVVVRASHVVYPVICPLCEKVPPFGEQICTHCLYRLPRTQMHREVDNAFTRRLWGRVPLQAAAAMLHYRKGNSVQQLVHEFKYKGKQDIGYKLFQRYGWQLRDQPHFADVDMIVPVPLHRRKLRARGYNQAKILAEGLRSGLNKPLIEAVVRSEHTRSQTRKGRMQRADNVSGVFQVPRPERLENKHLLLVDDVVTTGATLEACAQDLLSIPGIRISMVALAITE